MMEIRNNKLYIHNKLKPELPTRDFQCLSAYICPVCKNILKVYFVGTIPVEMLREYMEQTDLKHAYETGAAHGAQWISMDPYNHQKLCKWAVVGEISRGAEASIESFLQIHSTRVKSKQAFIEAIKSGKLSGFKLVEDVTGADLPILLYSEDELLSSLDLSFEERWKQLDHIGELIDSKLEARAQTKGYLMVIGPGKQAL